MHIYLSNPTYYLCSDSNQPIDTSIHLVDVIPLSNNQRVDQSSTTCLGQQLSNRTVWLEDTPQIVVVAKSQKQVGRAYPNFSTIDLSLTREQN